MASLGVLFEEICTLSPVFISTLNQCWLQNSSVVNPDRRATQLKAGLGQSRRCDDGQDLIPIRKPTLGRRGDEVDAERALI